MPEQRPPRVFISYSHDSEKHAQRVLRLANDLRSDGIEAIIDQYITSPSEGWPRWMGGHVRDDDFVVMVCTETYYQRVIGEEKPGVGLGVRWEGKLIYNHLYESDLTRFVPVLTDGGKRADIPEALRDSSYYFIDTPSGYEGLLRRLFNRPAAEMPPVGERRALPVLAAQWRERPLGRLHNVPDLPPNFVARPDDIAPVKALLMSDTGTVGITSGTRRAGLLGMGGIGKTVLATALARDEQIRKRFPDGAFWLSFGREATVTARQAELARLIGDKAALFDNWQQGRSRLSELTADCAALVVLDDVWQPVHAEGFTRLGTSMGLVVTTRDQAVLEKAGVKSPQVHRLDLLSKNAARALLRESAGLPVDALTPAPADEIARECGYLPLAISVVGALIRIGRFDWVKALVRLKAADIKRLRAQLHEYEAESLLAALQVSVEELPERERRAFGECVVLPEDVAVPEAALMMLWSEIYNDEEDALDTAQLFVERSLISRDQSRRYRLHDLYHDYLRATCPDLLSAHSRFVDAYRRQCPNGWATGPNDGYFFQHLPHHLAGANEREALRTILLDYRWIVAKLKAAGIAAVISDYKCVPDNEDLRRVQQTLRLSSHVIASDPGYLPAQLLGRLAPEDSAPIADLLAQVRKHAPTRALLPIRPTLNPPGTSLIRTFNGHQRPITAVATTPDGRVALSASMDGTLRLWDLETASELRCFGDHRTPAMCIAVFPDGKQALSGAQDWTISLWNLDDGTQLRTLTGHKGGVTAVAVLPDRRHTLSGAEDWTLRIWNIESGEELLCFRGHEDWVTAVAPTPDGQHAISGSFDRTLRLWDMKTARELRRFDGHEGTIRTVAVALDGKCAVSGADDQTVRLWDLQTGAELRQLDGHEGKITGVVILPNGRHAVSTSDDQTLRLWDLETGAELRRFYGHKGGITALTVLPDGEHVLSGSQDTTLALWNLHGRVSRRSSGHDSVVSAIAVTPDERCVLSASADRTLRLWDLETGTEVRRLEGHLRGINDLAILPNGRQALSASYDGTLRFWDLDSGQELFRFEGHKRGVTAVAVTSCGHYAVSGSFDDTLRLWDLQRGTEIRPFVGHKGGVTSVAVTPDGRRAMSASLDRSLCLWDLESGAELRRFEGHQDAATAVSIAPDGSHAVSGSFDGTLRLWDLESGKELCQSERHKHYIRVIDITPDARFAASAYLDYALYLWDLDTCTKRAAFQGDEPITCCAFARKGRWLVAGDRAGRIHSLKISN